MSKGTAPGLTAVLLGLVTYHVALRALPPSTSIRAVIATAYLLAGAALAIWILISPRATSPILAPQVVGYGLILGVAVTCIELGYAHAYRHGLSVSAGSLAALSALCLILIPLGAILFGESITWRQVAGMGLVLAGVLVAFSA